MGGGGSVENEERKEQEEAEELAYENLRTCSPSHWPTKSIHT